MSLLERYNFKLKEYENDEVKKNEYITMAAPYILRYQEENCRRDIFIEYMRDVEKDLSVINNEDITEKNTIQVDKCEMCNSQNTYECETSSSFICRDCGCSLLFYQLDFLIRMNKTFQKIHNTAIKDKIILMNGFSNFKERKPQIYQMNS